MTATRAGSMLRSKTHWQPPSVDEEKFPHHLFAFAHIVFGRGQLLQPTTSPIVPASSAVCKASHHCGSVLKYSWLPLGSAFIVAFPGFHEAGQTWQPVSREASVGGRGWRG
jgi:hypothetical protein